FTHPLAVVLAPQRLAPARVGDGEVQPLGVYVVPVLGGDVVSQGVLVAVLGDLGIPRGAGGEEHEHGVAAAGGVGLSLVHVGEALHLFVEVVPAQAVLPHHDLHVHRGTVLGGLVRLVGHLAVGGAQNGLDPGGREAVVEVVLHEQIGGGDDDSAHFVQGGDDKPELVVALEHHHHPVPPPDAQTLQVVGGLVGPAGDVREGKAPLHLVPADVEHGKLVRVLL